MNCSVKKLILLNLPYLLVFYVADKFAETYFYTIGDNIGTKLFAAMNYIGLVLQRNPYPDLQPESILFGATTVFLLKTAIYLKGKNAKKFRKGVEYGSAYWSSQKEFAPFLDKDFYNNILLTQSERLTLNGRPKNPANARNKNVLVIGGSGSGKTRFYVKPNIMQMHSSYIITDPKGSLINEVGKLLKENNYEMKVFNTINFSKSMHYNPLAYVHTEQDVLKLVTILMENTKGDNTSGGEDFWQKAEALYYQALIAYICFEAPEEEKNFATLLELLNASEVREDDENFVNAVDMLFEELKEENPNHFAVKQYTTYKLSAGKTAKSILISCGARLAPFNISEIRNLTAFDELELDTIGDKKTALFAIISDTDKTFSFLVAMLYSQMFNLLCEKADDKCGGRLPVHVRCIFDEFANCGKIPMFENLISTIRSREISVSIILQSKAQLKSVYKDNTDTIIDNCDSYLFLGGRGKETLKDITDMLGKETVDTYNTGDTRGTQRSYNLNYQKLGKELMSLDEIATMDGNKCILQLRGIRPFFSNKYDITKHSHYKYTSDFNKKNELKIEKLLSAHLDLKANDVYQCYEIELK